jgi:PAS domain S-box-containing protein
VAIYPAKTVHRRQGTTPGRRRARSPKRNVSRKVEAQRREAEEALRRSDLPFRRYFDLGLIGMAITSPTKGITEVNDELCRILGYERKELLQKTWPAMTHPEDLAAEVAQFKRVVAGKIDGYSLEKRWIRKDGRVIHSIMSAKCERLADGSVDYFLGLVLDITERKRAEDEQCKLASLVENSTDFIGMASPEGAVLYVNSAGQKLVGLNGSEAARTIHVTDYVMEEESERVQKAILPAVERTGAWQGEVRFRHFETGAAIPMLVNTFVMPNGGSGRPRVLATISRDITEIKQAEEELRRSAAYLAEGQRLSHTASWAWNVSTGEVFWSEELFRIYGLDPEQAKPGYPAVLDYIHPGDRSRAQRIFEEAVREKRGYELAYRVTRPDGTIRYVNNIAHPVFDKAGTLIEYVGTTIDNTERIRAEEKLRRSEAHLAEAQRIGQVGSWMWNVATGECSWSREHFRIFGLDADTFKPTKENTQRFIHREDLSFVEATLKKAVREKSEFELEYRIIRPNGSIRYHQGIGRPLERGNGELEFIGMVVDVTERKQAEKALQEIQTELAHVSRMTAMGEMAASIAHEINQPLGAIVNNGNFSLQLVGKPGVEKKQREALRDIVSDASRASNIISRVRALTKRCSPEPSELNVRELIGEVLTLAKHSLDEHGIIVKTKLPKEALTVHADRVQLQQVLLNLVVNAIEAMTGVPREKRILAIGAGRDKLDRKPAILVAIVDKGVGFAPKTAARMFDAFYTTKPDGMGMGLRISRSIIQGYGGQLSARRNKSGGATFSFVLPV